jgi:hypothetical protein
MKKAILSLLVATSLFAPQANARFKYDGNDVLRDCSSADEPATAGPAYNDGLCYGFVRSTYNMFVHACEAIPQESLLPEKWNAFCIVNNVPDRVTLGQLVKVYVKWLNDNPSKLHESADILLWEMLFETWTLPKIEKNIKKLEEDKKRAEPPSTKGV